MIGFMIVAFMAPTASETLANVQQHYAKQNYVSALFTQKVTNPTFGKTMISNGTVQVARPNKLRWDFGTNKKGLPKKSFIFDGKDLWMINHPNLEIIQSAANTSALPAAVAFLTNGATLTNNFTVSLTTTSGYGATAATVLELVPKAPSAQLEKLFLVVDSADWHVAESIVVDLSDTVTDLMLSSPSAAAIAASTFVFSPKQYPTYKHVVVPATPPPTPATKPTKPSTPAKRATP